MWRLCFEVRGFPPLTTIILRLLTILGLTDLIQCKINFAECARSLQPGSTSEPSLVKAASPSLGGLATTNQSSRNARTTIGVWWTRKIGQPAKLVVSASVSWWECPSLALATVDVPIGSRSIVSCNRIFKIQLVPVASPCLHPCPARPQPLPLVPIRQPACGRPHLRLRSLNPPISERFLLHSAVLSLP